MTDAPGFSGSNGPAPEQTRINLHAAGYDPVPVKGKWPHFPGWQKLGATNPEEIRLWTGMHFDHESTGILTARTPAFDIDILDPEAAQAVEDLVHERFDERGTVMVRFGRAPKRAVLFQTEKPFSKIACNFATPHENEKLELLGNGQQLVAFGKHVETGKPYAWFGGEPGAVERDDLPGITEEQAHELLRAAVEVLEPFGYRLEGKKSSGVGDATDWADCSDANLIDHDVAMRFAMKLMRAGMSDGAVVNMLKAKIASLDGVDDERRKRRLHEIPSMVARKQVSQCTASEPFISLSNRSQSARPALKCKFGLIQPSGEWSRTHRNARMLLRS